MNNKLFSVVTKVFNGTVILSLYISVYPTEELAEKVKAAIEKKNTDSKFKIVSEVVETAYFENEKDVPILNENDDI